MLTDLSQRNDLSAEHRFRSPSGGQLSGGEVLQTLNGSQSAAHKIQDRLLDGQSHGTRVGDIACARR